MNPFHRPQDQYYLDPCVAAAALWSIGLVTVNDLQRYLAEDIRPHLLVLSELAHSLDCGVLAWDLRECLEAHPDATLVSVLDYIS